MASIRRTLSPVPRVGAIQNGEAHSVPSPSPLSKSSFSQAQNNLQSGGLMSINCYPLLYNIKSVVLGLFSQRLSRPVDRSKTKASLWRKAAFHFTIFFMIGIFVGFTPFVSMNSSIHLESMHQAFSFDNIPPARDVQHYGSTFSNRSLPENSVSNNNTKSDIQTRERELMDVIPDAESPIEEFVFTSRKLLIVVTPTYTRPFQAYYLHRLAHTLKLVTPPLLWIVVEMSSQSDETADLLRRTGVMYRHLVCDKNLTSIKDRRVHQRNVALTHIEKHRLDGVVYFADDDNMYSVDLFEQIHDTRRFSIWPIAILTESKNRVILEGPVCNGSQVNGWHSNDRTRRVRRFHADMSGFAFNSTILWDPKRWRRPSLEPIRQLDTLKEGFKDSNFVEQVVEDESQMEGLRNCSGILVWRLHLETSYPFYPHTWLLKKNLDVVEPLM